jgi:hypothetical protein
LAATLVGAVDTRLGESGADLWQGDHRLYEQAATAARAALGDEQFAALREAGREFPFAAAVAAGLSVAVPDTRADSSSPAPTGSDVALTAREG